MFSKNTFNHIPNSRTASLAIESVWNTVEWSGVEWSGHCAWAGAAAQELLQEVGVLVHLLPLGSELGVAS